MDKSTKLINRFAWKFLASHSQSEKSRILLFVDLAVTFPTVEKFLRILLPIISESDPLGWYDSIGCNGQYWCSPCEHAQHAKIIIKHNKQRSTSRPVFIWKKKPINSSNINRCREQCWWNCLEVWGMTYHVSCCASLDNLQPTQLAYADIFYCPEHKFILYRINGAWKPQYNCSLNFSIDTFI